jgi:hypothetical protein
LHSKPVGIVVAAIIVSLAWLWITRDSPQSLAEPKDTSAAGSEPREPGDQSKRALTSPRNPLPEGASGERAGSEPRGVRPRAPSRETGAARARGASAGDTQAETPSRTADTREPERGREGIDRIEKLLEALRAGSRPGGEPFELDTLDLHPDDLARLDLDQDSELAPWELIRAEQLIDLTDHYPVRGDLHDDSYPMERRDYNREEWEFDAVDANRDDRIDADEYHALVVEAEKVSRRLDSDGDRYIDRSESGLSENEFEPLDFNDSGTLKDYEIRRAVALGVLE